MTPEVEARIKEQTWERMRTRLGNDYFAEHTDFLESQWALCLELGMVDEETDLIIEEVATVMIGAGGASARGR